MKSKELEQLVNLKHEVENLKNVYDEEVIFNSLRTLERRYAGPEIIWVKRLINQAICGQIPLHDVSDSMGKFIRQVEVEVKD